MSEELDDIVDNLREPSAWIRIIFMVGFALVLYLIMAPIIAVLLIVQALFSVITGDANSNLKSLGRVLSLYIKQIIDYLTYNSSLRPFPFSDFPELDEESVSETASEDEGEPVSKPAAKKSAANKSSAKKTGTKKTAARKAPAKKKTKKKSDEQEAAVSDTDASADSATEQESEQDKKDTGSSSD